MFTLSKTTIVSLLDNVNYDWLVKVNKNVKTGDKNSITVFVQHPSDKVTV